MELLKVGKIIKTYGLQGEVKVYSTTDFPNIRFKKNNSLIAKKDGEEDKTFVVKRSKSLGGNLFSLAFEGLLNINLVEPYIGYELFVEKDSKVLPKNTYFYSDLEQCEVFDEYDNIIGSVETVEDFGGKISLRIITKEKKKILVPFVEFFIKNVDIENKKIVIHIIEGLL